MQQTQQDQATELRRLVSAQAAQPVHHGGHGHGDGDGDGNGGARLMAISSGKGGVGKSNVAVNLAARLAQMGRRVALLDADMGLANADLLCDGTPRANLAHVIAGRKDLIDAMAEGPGGFTLIPGASGLARAANLSECERSRVVSLYRELSSAYDLLLLDTGAGVGPNVLSYLLAADEILVATTAEPTSITDAYALIKAVSRQRETVHVSLLTNMVRDRAEGRRVYDRLSSVCQRFLGLVVRDAGHVVMDGRVPGSVRRRVPFVLDAPDAAASLCIRQLAHKVDRYAAEPGERGFLRRVRAWLTG
jgi:flagellar biosynthesis protein FlhG